MQKKIISGLFCLILSSNLSFAEGNIQALPTDERAKVTEFYPDQIYPIKTNYLISTDIIFAKNEIVDNSDVHLGDAAAWDVEIARNHLYLKAKKIDAGGNLSVTTNKRDYHFILTVANAAQNKDDQTVFLKFIYPETKHPKKSKIDSAQLSKNICANKDKFNLQYSFTGDQDLAPLQTCDDGTFTYFKFAKQADFPAFFRVLPDQSEEVVNYRVNNGYVVVERIAKEFTLRSGKQVTNIYNDRLINLK